MTNTLADFMAEEEARRIEETRREVAKEDAAWAAMTPAQQAEVIAAREARFAAITDAGDADEDIDEDIDEDEE